jgi:hypothetical protein
MKKHFRNKRDFLAILIQVSFWLSLAAVVLLITYAITLTL